MRSFVKIEPSQNSQITLLFTDLDKSYPGREILTCQICILKLFAKKFSRNFPNLQNYNRINSLVWVRQISFAEGP